MLLCFWTSSQKGEKVNKEESADTSLKKEKGNSCCFAFGPVHEKGSKEVRKNLLMLL